MSELPPIDTSDIDRWIGVPLGGGNLKDPLHLNDFRRWVQAMQNPHPLHYDEEYAAASRFGGIVAPQSFVVCTSDSHGAAPAIQGRIEGSQMLFGGDEWWFETLRLAAGDLVVQERKLVDYKVRETKFAGPAVFARGDTIYRNQRGEVVAKQRSTSIRYRPEEARKRREASPSAAEEDEPIWSDDELRALEAKKRAYYQTFRELGHGRRAKIEKGEKLPTRPMGPHTALTFATEWRAYLMNVWGAFKPDGLPTSLRQAGWLPEMDKDMAAARIDPAEADGLYKGSSRGHAQAKYARLIGLPRGYGYGASMGAWVLDYITNWAGEWGHVVHSNVGYRAPVYTGDISFLDGEVTAVDGALLSLKIEMTNQKGAVLVSGTAEVRFD